MCLLQNVGKIRQRLEEIVPAGHGFVMKIGDFGMSRHMSLTKRPDGTVSLVRQLSTGAVLCIQKARVILTYSISECV